MSETLAVGILLALTGGFLDAYTYFVRGGVFANAETGNMVLFGMSLLNGEFGTALTYLFPILCFFAGILVAEAIKHRMAHTQKVHWRQLVIALEAAVLICVSFLPETLNMPANSMIAFVCSLQVESFRKVNGNPYATTMCTGNLRSAAENLYRYRLTRDRKLLLNGVQYLTIIVFFICGAGAGAMLTPHLSYRAVWAAVALLAVVSVLMASERKFPAKGERI